MDDNLPNLAIINAIVNNGLNLMQQEGGPVLNAVGQIAKFKQNYDKSIQHGTYSIDEFIEDVYMTMSGMVRKARLGTDGLKRVVSVSKSYGIRQTTGEVKLEDFFSTIANKRSEAIIYLHSFHKFLKNIQITKHVDLYDETNLRICEIMDDILLIADEFVLQNDLEYTRVYNIKLRLEQILDDMWNDDYDDFDDDF